MTRERAKELMPIIQAFAEGKIIQVKTGFQEEQWEDCDDAAWYDTARYRIKPEPREFWIVVYDNAETEKYSPTAHSSLESARCMASEGILHAKIYHCTGDEVT